MERNLLITCLFRTGCIIEVLSHCIHESNLQLKSPNFRLPFLIEEIELENKQSLSFPKWAMAYALILVNFFSQASFPTQKLRESKNVNSQVTHFGNELFKNRFFFLSSSYLSSNIFDSELGSEFPLRIHN